MSSSNSSSRNAAQRERERRAAARAKRQAAKAAATPAHAEGATGEPREQLREQPREQQHERVAVPARKETKGAVMVPDAEAAALPMADQHGTTATWMMLAVVVLLGLLAIAVMAAS